MPPTAARSRTPPPSTSGNDGGGTSNASVTVQCPDIKVTKTPDNGVVNVGDPIVWTIKVENIGQGIATGVVVTDTLARWPRVVGIRGRLLHRGRRPHLHRRQTSPPAPRRPTRPALRRPRRTAARDQQHGLGHRHERASEPAGQQQHRDRSPSSAPRRSRSSRPPSMTRSRPANSPASRSSSATPARARPRTSSINDTLPGGIDWIVDDTTHCGIAAGVLTCTFASIAAGDHVTVLVTGETSVDDCGTLRTPPRSRSPTTARPSSRPPA